MMEPLYIFAHHIKKKIRNVMLNKLFVILAAVILISACSKKEEPKPQMAASTAKAAHEVVVQEVVSVTEYTYLRVKEGDKEYWMAAPKAEIKVGEVLTYNKAMEMKDFESKELKKKFDSVFFVDNLDAKLGTGTMNSPQKPVITQENLSVEKAADGITIAQLFSNPSNYANQVVKIKGKVVKLNSGIMGKNWAHIQDGTKSGSDFDLTVTTNDKVSKEDVVTFTGKIVLNKDFGYGYSYKVLMEDARSDSKPSYHKINM
jgi:hypothetical protein